MYIPETCLSNTQEIDRAMTYRCGLKAYTELGILLAANGASLTLA